MKMKSTADNQTVSVEENSSNKFKKVLGIAVAMILSIALAASGATGLVSATIKTYTVTDGVKSESFTTYEKLDSAKALAKTSLTADNNDKIELDSNGNNYAVKIVRNCEISLTADGKTEKHIVEQTNLSDALDKLGVKIGKDDVVSLSLASKLSEGMKVKIDRVSYDTVTKTEELDYKAYTALASTVKTLDGSAVKQGQTGVVTHVYKNKLVNGKVEKSELVEQKLEKVTGTPTTTASTTTSTTSNSRTTTNVKVADNVSGAVAYASSGKAVSCVSELAPSKTVLLDDNGVPLNYSNVITGPATAYSGDGTTSTGVTPRPGYVAVDPSEIPYGSKLYIVSTDGIVYGYAIAADTGGFIYNSSTVVDLYYNTESECINFGRRNVKIYVLS